MDIAGIFPKTPLAIPILLNWPQFAARITAHISPQKWGYFLKQATCLTT